MHAELSLIEEFIGERQMIGETGRYTKHLYFLIFQISIILGYCLSTFQTCLFYISSLDWKEADSQHQEIQNKSR